MKGLVQAWLICEYSINSFYYYYYYDCYYFILLLHVTRPGGESCLILTVRKKKINTKVQ